MSVLSLGVPDSLHRQARELGARDGISINQFVARVVAEKMSAPMTEDHLRERALRGSRAKYEAALEQVPDEGHHL